MINLLLLLILDKRYIKIYLNGYKLVYQGTSKDETTIRTSLC